MGTQYEGITEAKKTSLRTVKRKSAKAGYRPKAVNALYRLAKEYRRRHPKSTAAEAWRHLIAVAETGAHEAVLAHDTDADTLSYRPDPDKFATRTIKFASFASRLSRLG